MYIEMKNLLPGIPGLPRRVVSHGSGLSRQVSVEYLYTDLLGNTMRP